MTYIPKLGDRSLFPRLEPRVYMNHAAIAPASVAVEEAVRAVAEDYGRRGLGAFNTWHDQREGLRVRLARLVNASPTDIAFVPNTTRGVTDVALCFPWRPGDRVLLFRGEFPSNVTPWQRAAALFGVEVVFGEADAFRTEEGLSRLEEELKRGVRLVAVSAVEFQTGLRMPLAEISAVAHRHGAELFVDAVQAVGATPVDVQAQGIDYLSCGSHKWLMGLEGGGFLYVRPERLAALRPAVAGWLSHEDGMGFLHDGAGLLRYDRPIRRRIDFVEGGNVSNTALAALDAAVSLTMQVGVENVWAHANRINDALEEVLVARGFESVRHRDPARRSCTLSAKPPAGWTVAALQTALGERGISCSTPDGHLRFSPHWPNSIDEVPVVAEALDAILGRR